MRRPRSVREELRSFSQGKATYHEAYEAAMKRIDAQGYDDKTIAHRAILVVAFARRMLTASEFCHAASVDTQEAFDLADVATLEDILSTCAGLMSYQQEADQIQLVHQSTKEYFKDTESRWFPDGEAIMRDICDTYNEACEAPDAAYLPHHKLTKYPFLAYSSLHYASHRIRAEEGIVASVLPQTQNDFGSRDETTPEARPSGLRRFGQEFADLDDVLNSSIQHGRFVVVEFILQMNPTLRGARLNESLRIAVQYGHKDIVSLILDNKADILVPDQPLSILSIAAQEGRLEIMKHLLHWDSSAVHSMLYRRNDRTAAKIFPDDYDLIEALMELYPNTVASVRTPLALAAKRGHLECVRFLLDLISKDVESDARTRFWERVQAIARALVCYIRGDNLQDHRCETDDFLIQEFDRASPDAEDDSTFAISERQRRCRQWRTRCANLILDDILSTESTSTPDAMIMTIIFEMAVGNGMPDIAQRVDRLELNTNPRNETYENGLTTLHILAGYGCSWGLKRLLKEKVVDINIGDYNGRTALVYATQGGHLESVQIILEQQDLDVNATDQDGIGVIHCAARKGDSAVLAALLKRSDLDLNKQDKYGNTAIHHVAGRRNMKLTRLLSCKTPSDPSHLDGLDSHEGQGISDVEWNKRFREADDIHFDIISLLVQQPNMIVDSMNARGLTPLHQAVNCLNNGSLSALLLSQRNVGVNRKDPRGRTPLMSAIEPWFDLGKIPEMWEYRLKFVNTLLENWSIVMGETDHRAK